MALGDIALRQARIDVGASTRGPIYEFIVVGGRCLSRVKSGSDGTRTRDLRRDRPAF
jgi:hypothetical protein